MEWDGREEDEKWRMEEGREEAGGMVGDGWI